MRPFSLIVPTDLADASTQGAANDAVFKAAGMDLVDRMKERIDSPPKVVNLLSLRTDLSGINVEASGVRIGALSTLTQVSEAEALQQPAYRALSWAAGDAATPQVRNRATIAGNIIQVNRCWYYRSAGFTCAHQGGDFCLAMFGENRYHSIMGTSNCLRVHPSNVAPTLMVLDAQIAVYKDGQTRTLAIRDLYPSNPSAINAEHTLEPGEIITAIFVPAFPEGTRSAYVAAREKQSFDWPATAAAARLTLNGGTISDAAICLGSVAPVPYPRDEAANFLKGKKASVELFKEAAEMAFNGAIPQTHNEYKIPLGKATLVDALLQAAGRS